MEYAQLARTGLHVSQICFGTWRFGKETDGQIETTRDEAIELLDTAWDLGINFIDTANSYGFGKSEEYIGAWLENHDREDIVIASKVLWAHRGTSIDPLGRTKGPIQRKGISRKGIRAELQGSLDRLGTDYLDIYYIHSWDENVPVRETLSTLNDLVREGLVHSIAVSNIASWQLMETLWQSDVQGWERFEIVQPKFNAAVSNPGDGLLEVCADQTLAVCPYSPLHGGFLTGKYGRGQSPPQDSRGEISSWGGRFSDHEWDVLATIQRVSEDIGATPAQVALRWLIDGPVQTIPIVGARTPSQLEENAGAVNVSLSDQQWKGIAKP